VYKTRAPRLGCNVAIKFASERFTDRFEQEARSIVAGSNGASRPASLAGLFSSSIRSSKACAVR